jgi:dTDP-4-amino-4,6-dideoxygalactose transaminase
MRVSLLDLRRQRDEIGSALDEAVARVLDSGAFVLGEDVPLLEEEIAARMRRQCAVGVSSGSDALLVTLMALGIGFGDEVITTPYSFFATVGAIRRVGARPVFVDVDPEHLLLDPEAAAMAVTSRTRAIVPVHLFGKVAPLAPLLATGIAVVEDAAQAIDAAGVGAGRAATLSFFPSKNLGAAGDGGMVLTDDEELAERIRLLRVHGSKPKYIHSIVGGNFRLDTIQAAILRAKLPWLSEWNERRRAHAMRLRDGLADLPVQLPKETPGQVWHQFVIRTPRRDELREALKSNGVETEIYYPLALHLQPCFRDLGYRPGSLPVAEQATREALALPIHAQLTAEQIDYVITTIRGFFGR